MNNNRSNSNYNNYNKSNKDNYNSGRNRFSDNKNNRSDDFKKNDGGYKSDRTGDKPNRFGDKPNRFGDKPNRFGDKPNRFGDKPNRFGDKPNRFGDKPNFKKSDGGYKSDRTGDKPNRFGDKPNRFGDKPKSNYSSQNGRYSEKSDNFDNNRKPYNTGDGGKFNKFKKTERFDNRGKNFTDKRGDNRGERFNKFDKNPNIKLNKTNYSDDINNINIISGEVVNIPNSIVENVEQEDSGMVYGRNAVLELLKSNKSIDKIFVQNGQREGSITMIVAEAIRKSIPVIEVEKNKLDSMINNSGHQGVIALAAEKEYCSVDDILNIAKERNQKPFIIIADKIMDPHNLGAIIRTAECAGVHGIIIPKRNACGVSPIVAKTSAGASVHMAVAKVANIANTIEELKEKGVWAVASTIPDENTEDDIKNINCKNYADVDYNLPIVLIVGNEGEGLSPIIIQKSDFHIKIPMFGKIESLNVSCASAILMYEVAKQRKTVNDTNQENII